MYQKKLIPLLALVISLATLRANACTIFMANDGHNVWIGNNEDEVSTKKYRMWYYPAKSGDNGYMIWTELAIGKAFYGLMYLMPQGGLNEYGLFMDYTAINDIPIVRDAGKKDRKKQVVTDILKKCKTVDEALMYINNYNLIRLNGAQLFIGDASGNYAIVTGGYIVRKSDKNFALTNYCVNNGHREACWRRDVADQFLHPDKTYQLADIKSILNKTTQKAPNGTISNYSMAVDLKTATIHLFYKNDFTTEAVISLQQELKKGKHHRDLVTYFPESLSPILLKAYTKGGVGAVIDKYKFLRSDAAEKYNFKNNDAVDLAIPWIEKSDAKDAIQFLETLKEYDPGNIGIYTWLGVAYRKDSNRTESDKNFAKALTLDPDDYLATLWGRQENQKVTFKMNDFEGAEQVSLLADFTQWKPIKMTKEGGVWTYTAQIPRGEYNYRFLVNKEYLADQMNLMYTRNGYKVYSRLYVW